MIEINNTKLVVFAFDDNYVMHGVTAITSLLENNKNINFEIGVLTDYFSDNSTLCLNTLERKYSNCKLSVRIVEDDLFNEIGQTISYISKHTYYRYIIANIFKDSDQALYLDSDLIINGSLSDLLNTDLNNYYAAAVPDAWIMEDNYQCKLGFRANEFYFNAGVILFNLNKIREEGFAEKFFKINIEWKDNIIFQDQDVLNLALRNKVKSLDIKYNFTLKDVLSDFQKGTEAIIVHYTGSIKPWTVARKHPNKLDYLYFKYLKETCFGEKARKMKFDHFITRYTMKKKRKKKVALIVDEFFGGAGTAFGGYGFLARNLICKYLPNDDFIIDVLISENKDKWAFKAKKTVVDNTKVYVLPGRKFARMWMKRQKYDLFFSIEYTWDALKYISPKRAKLLHWIQDPRPWEDWKEIQTVKLFPEGCYWNSALYDRVHDWSRDGKVRFITQGNFLKQKARDLYRLPEGTRMDYFPNPIDINYGFSEETTPKENIILFVGRIESVKRGWLFCEIAKLLPEYQFCMMGQTFREKEENQKIMGGYSDIPNLHFLGHLEGEEKNRYYERAKILVNTSIHEAIPITFLEALSYGVLLVSCQNPDGLTERFGKSVGLVYGDGFDKVQLFVDAIRELMSDDQKRLELSKAAIDYVKADHSVQKFVKEMRSVINEELNK
ncbi:MAG: glycosyltransferase [Bacteroidales bacterium]